MTLLLWAAIGIAMGHLVAGRPLVIFYIFGVLTIDLRPIWRVIGAISAVIGGVVGNQLFGSTPIPLSTGLASAWSGLVALLLAPEVELAAVLTALASPMLARAAVAAVGAIQRTHSESTMSTTVLRPDGSIR